MHESLFHANWKIHFIPLFAGSKTPTSRLRESKKIGGGSSMFIDSIGSTTCSTRWRSSSISVYILVKVPRV